MATAAKFDLPIAIFLVYLIQLEVDVTGNVTAKLCEVGSEFKKFLHLGYHGNGHHFEFVQTRIDCVWMQTQKFPNNPHIRIQGTNQFLTSKYP